MPLRPTDDLRHDGAVVEEWVFATWTPGGDVGIVSGHRLRSGGDWYWAVVVQAGYPMLHLTEWEVVRRADPFVVKAPEMWAEHHCVAPMEQWSIGNEAHAAALDDADEALGRGYGVPTPMATDLEWYATEPAIEIDRGYEQVGVVHGLVELLGRPNIDLHEVPAHRWHRWGDHALLAPVDLPGIVAHTGLRAPVAFPDGSVADWVLSPHGWRSRRPR
ncbi:MAG: hypothetical protein ABIO83_09640 [Ilumatobacteraceae bacterium]